MLAIEQRKSDGNKTLGNLFAEITEQQRASEIGDVLNVFCDAVFSALEGTVHLSQEQMNQFVDNLVGNLPDSILRYLHFASTWKDDDEDPPTKKNSPNKKVTPEKTTSQEKAT